MNEISFFSTCPPSTAIPKHEYLARVEQVSRWSDDAGFRGMLIYTDNSLVDPWLLAEFVIRKTEHLNPLIAVQPVYMHPYTAAKLIASLAYLYGRRIDLNIVAGGFRNDLLALGDPTEHDARYDRAVEYGTIISRLLTGAAVTFDGAFYGVKNLRLTPAVPPELQPGLLLSGSSPAGLAAARTLGATPVKYPKPPGEEDAVASAGLPYGARLGVIARDDAQEAWRVARDRFPEDRRGQLTHELALRVSDSHWHRQLSKDVDLGENGAEPEPYWLVPFQNYKTFCPYFVGSYERVGRELAGYVDRGFDTFILDVPASAEELAHTREAFSHALVTSSR